MKADGTVLECSESSNADVFQAARVHLGCLGVILTVTLQCVPQFHLLETSFPSTLKEVLVFGSPFPSIRKQIEVLTKGLSLGQFPRTSGALRGPVGGLISPDLPWPKRDWSEPWWAAKPRSTSELTGMWVWKGFGQRAASGQSVD
jgi:hypothetical protein